MTPEQWQAIWGCANVGDGTVDQCYQAELYWSHGGP